MSAADEIWICGRHSVLEALRAGQVRRIFLAAGRAPSDILSEVRTLSATRGIEIREVPTAELERLTGTHGTQGIAGLVGTKRMEDVSDLLTPVAGASPHFLLVLDQIQDPQNLGALLRTADAAGIGGVILPERRSAPLSGAVARASAGALSHVRVAQATNLARAIELIKRAGIWTIGLDGEARQTIYEIDLTVPLALVLGSEGGGIRRLTRELCDFLAHIPMQGSVESLNVAVAGAIAMYEVVRQRRDPRAKDSSRAAAVE